MVAEADGDWDRRRTGTYQSAKLQLSPGTSKVLGYIVHRTEFVDGMFIAFDCLAILMYAQFIH